MEVVLAPLDNVRLANLCGPLDENLRQIETGFDVAIAGAASASRFRAKKPR